MTTRTLEPEVLHRMDAYWRAANYLSVGQIYLYDNPLLKRPLQLSDVKPLVVGHWGTTPVAVPDQRATRAAAVLGLEDDPNQWRAARGSWTALDEHQLIRLLTDSAP